VLRTLFVLIIAAAGLGATLLHGPFYALLSYLWIAYFRPDEWVWGGSVVSSLSLSFVTGLLLIGTTALSGPRLRFNMRIAVLGLFLVQTFISTLLSPHFDYAWPYWQDFAKVVLITWLLVALVVDVKHLRAVILVIALSLGFEAAKQGWAQLILNPGEANLNTLPSIGDNNSAAVAVLMLVPLLLALANTASARWQRVGFRFMSIGVIYRAITTYSRGGFVSALVLGVLYFQRSRHKVRTLAAMLVVVAVVVPVLPEAFWTRINTIAAPAQERDTSSEGRLHFWSVAIDMANANPFSGIGHNAYKRAYNRYDSSHGQYGQNRAVHSLWFGVLAEHGYPGFVLFVANLMLAFLACRRVRRLGARDAAFREIGQYATAIEISLVVCAVGGSFVIFQYVEILWHLIGLTIVLHVLTEQATAEAREPQQASITPRVAGAFGMPLPVPGYVARSIARPVEE